MPPVLTAEQVAELLDCSVEKIATETLAHRLPAVRFGRSWVYPLEALMECLNARARGHLTLKDQPVPEPVAVKVVPIVQEVRRGRARSVRPALPDFSKEAANA